MAKFAFVKAQDTYANFYAIDARAQNITAATPDSLSTYLIAGYTTELQKVRSIYSWIVQHIAYNTRIFKPGRQAYRFTASLWDTAAIWKSGDEITAQRVMHRGVAVCEGYAKLFKVLCGYAGIEAKVIMGYAKNRSSLTKFFTTNHSWNAVKINNTWYLLDVTWASGYINYLDDFVPQQNDFYFLTPPQDFGKEHYPEELQWALLQQPLALTEFKKSPFRSKNFNKYSIVSYQPTNGQIEAAIGDTIHFSLALKDYKKALAIGSDLFFDSTSLALSPASVFISPVQDQPNHLSYQYIVERGTEWIHLVLNYDIILRYRLLHSPVNGIALQ